MSPFGWFLLLSVVVLLGVLGYALLRWDDAITERDQLRAEVEYLRGELVTVHGSTDWEW